MKSHLSHSTKRLPTALPALVLLLALVLGLGGRPAAVQAQQPHLRASVLSVGANGTGDGGIVLESTLGQAVVGPSLGNVYRVNAGFWYQAQPPVVVAVNQPPSAAQITEPPDGSDIVIGGAVGALPRDAATPFVVVWSEAADPEGDPISYTWQLARDDAFATLLLNQETGGTARHETTLGAIAAVLDAAGVALNGSLTLRHRVLASDGRSSTASATARITLLRGTLTATDDEPGVPAVFALHPNYPNPFNPATTIAYELTQASGVRLVVYDLFGRVVRTLVEKHQGAGRHTVVFEAGGLASGTYVYRIEAGAWSQARTLVVLR